MYKTSLLLCIAFLLFGCEKLTQFTLEDNTSVIIPSSTGINLPFSVGTPDMTNSFEQKFESNDTRKKYIEEFKLTSLVLSIVEPPNFNFSFLKDIEIFIVSDGLAEKRIAYKLDIDNTVGSTLTCDISEENLADYVKADNFSLKVEVVTDELFSQDVEINIFSQYFVDAKLI